MMLLFVGLVQAGMYVLTQYSRPPGVLLILHGW